MVSTYRPPTSFRFYPFIEDKITQFQKEQRILGRTRTINQMLLLAWEAYQLLKTKDIGYITPLEQEMEDSIMNTLTPEQRERFLERLTMKLGEEEVRRIRELAKDIVVD